MKLKKIIVLCALSLSAAAAFASGKVTLDYRNKPLYVVLKEVTRQSGYTFVYSDQVVKDTQAVTISVKNADITQAMNRLVSGAGFTYRIEGKKIYLMREAPKAAPAKPQTGRSGKVSIKGRVLDSGGQPVIGATVMQAGTNNGVITDLDGNYTLSVEPGSSVDISYIGCKPQSFKVSEGRSSYDVVMTEENAKLDEVVVIGYGSMKKSDLTSSISSVNAKTLSQTSTTNLTDALQGRVPGLDIQSDRYDGENRNFFIRGTRSLQASNTPLTIVDGVPASLSDVNVHDIESVEVMKDAASAAIYGSQGANGVIIITTKRGKSGKTTISYDGYYGIRKPEFIDMMNGEKFVQMKRDAYLMANNMWTPGNKGTVDDALLFTDDELAVIKSGRYVDWYDLVYRNGSTQSNNLTISGGNDKTKIKVNMGYDTTRGYVKTNDTKTLYVNLSVDHKINSWASMGATVRFKSRKNSGFATYGQGLYYGTPVDRAYDDEGRIIEIPNPNEGAYNILLNYQDGQYVNDRKTEVVNLLGFADLKFYKDLSMHTNIGYNTNNERTGYFYGKDSYTSHGLNRSGRSAWHSSQLTLNNTLTYSHQFDRHNLVADFVQEIQKYQYDDLSASGENEDVELLTYYNLKTNTQNKDIGSSFSNWAMASFMGRVRYDYMGRYLFNASIRSDGSSRLAKGNKWGSFLSVGLAWRITQEKFMENVKAVSNLKLRMSFGEVGNQAIAAYQTLAMLDTYPVLFGDDGLYAYRPNSLVNNKLGWERTKTYNLGLDFGLFKDKVTGSIDLYNSKTSDLLMLRALPTSIGFSRIYDNIGATENKGVELSLNYHAVRSSNLNVDAYGTLTYNKNRIKKLSTSEDDITNGWFIGRPISVVYDYKKIGIWQTYEKDEAAKYNCVPGDIKIEDRPGTTEGINADDKTFIGQLDPKLMMSFGVSVELKNFDFSINASGRFGHLIWAEPYGYNLITSGNRWCADIDYWTPDNPSNTWPRAANDIANRSLCAYFKGDYIKIQDMTLGYDFAALLNKCLNAAVSKARLYVQLRNFAYIYKAVGNNLNPESPTSEIAVPKCINFGVNINF